MSSQQCSPHDDAVHAEIAKVVEDSYVVTYPVRDYGDLTIRDSVTFSLPDWQGDREPEPGQVVELINAALYARGWRARNARPVAASSQQFKQKRRA